MPRGKPNQDPDATCKSCGQPLPVVALCEATAKSTGERCTQPAEPGWTVCRFHGAGGGRPPSTFRYARALHANPELAAAYEAIQENAPDEFDLTDEILLARARVHAAIGAGTVDLKTITEMLRDVTRAVQKNIELKIKMQGLVQKRDAEALLKRAVQVIVRFVPDNQKPACFEELTRALAGGGGLLALGQGDE